MESTSISHRLSSEEFSAWEFFTDSSGFFNHEPDLVLIVENVRFYCHRVMLKLVSSVFTGMFNGQFQEHNAREIVLKDKTSQSILELLRYIYPQFRGQVNNQNIEELICLADEYIINCLKNPCRVFLVRQLRPFEFVLVPTQEKREKSLTRSTHFHRSESPFNSLRVSDIPIATPRHFRHTHEARTASGKANRNSSTPSRYVLLDKTRIPTFYDKDDDLIPFTSTDVDQWLRRLRILYRVDKEEHYGEVIDLILGILQFVPGADICKWAQETDENYSMDDPMMNDIACARMYMLEEWGSDGNAYRSVKLTNSYRATRTNASIDNRAIHF